MSFARLSNSSAKSLARMLLAVAFLFWTATAQAASVRFLPPNSDEPANHRSFVRDNNPAGRRLAAWDSSYANDLRNSVTAASVDVLFQQCFGGGFHNDIGSSGPASYTSASAARYDEVAFNKDNVNAFFRSNRSLDNFTRAYRDAALNRSAQGVLDWYRHATEGGDGITKDPFAIAGAGTQREHPVYWTPDPDATNAHANNSRTFVHTAGAGNANQYAILVGWSAVENRHAVNMARMYDLLRDVFGVPRDNIVVLSGNSAFGDRLGDWTSVDGDAEYNAFIDGNNRRETWLAALRGELFSTGGQVGGNIPDANDKLFIYNTGHGGQAWRRDGAWVVDNNASNLATDAAINLRADGLNFDFAPTTEEASSIMNDPLGTGSMMIQLLLSQTINPDATLTIPGVGSISAGASQVLSPSDVFYYNGMLSDSLVAYQFDVPFNSLASVANAFEMQFDGLHTPYLRDDLVAALSFFGGDQEHAYLFQTIPEPTTLALVLLFLFAAAACERPVILSASREVGTTTAPQLSP